MNIDLHPCIGELSPGRSDSILCSDSVFDPAKADNDAPDDVPISGLSESYSEPTWTGLLHESSIVLSDQAFDPFLSVSAEKRNVLVAHLFPLCEDAKRRQRKRRQRDRANYCDVLAVVIANALRAADHSVNKRVHYSRKAGMYSGQSVYHPPFLRTPTLRAVVDALASLKLLSLEKGRSGFEDDDGYDGPRHMQSTFQATRLLRSWLKLHDIGMDDVRWLTGRPAIVLKDENKVRISYDADDPQTLQMAKTVEAFNDFIQKHEVSLNLPQSELEKMYRLPERTGKPRPPINFSDIALHRVFNNGRFDHGGRWCGGWWINVPSKYRDHLLIDGSPTVELDYSGCFLRMLYHLKGIEAPVDPYDIPEIKKLSEKQKLVWTAVRRAIKELTNIYLNALPESKIGCFPNITHDLPKGLRRPKKLYELIREHHPKIEDKFQTGCGLELMRHESDICADILADGIMDGVLVLPIYDSFVVEKRSEDWLRMAMTENYRRRLKFDPVIKAKEADGGLKGREENISHAVGLAGGVVPSSSLIGEHVRQETGNGEGPLFVNMDYPYGPNSLQKPRQGSGRLVQGEGLWAAFLESSREGRHQ